MCNGDFWLTEEVHNCENFKECECKIWDGIDRPHKELCVSCWSKKYPKGFQEYLDTLVTREPEK